jgi:hypothetical protein
MKKMTNEKRQNQKQQTTNISSLASVAGVVFGEFLTLGRLLGLTGNRLQSLTGHIFKRYST